MKNWEKKYVYVFVKVGERLVVTLEPGNCQYVWEGLINAGEGQFQPQSIVSLIREKGVLNFDTLG